MTVRTYNVSGPEGIGQDCETVRKAVIAATQIAIEYGKATITSSHWPDDWRFEVQHDEATRETEARLIQFGIEERDYKAEKRDDD